MSSSQADMNGSTRSRFQAYLRLRDEKDRKSGFVYSIKHGIPIVQGISCCIRVVRTWKVGSVVVLY